MFNYQMLNYTTLNQLSEINFPFQGQFWRHMNPTSMEFKVLLVNKNQFSLPAEVCVLFQLLRDSYSRLIIDSLTHFTVQLV